jgi:hypothetical protein
VRAGVGQIGLARSNVPVIVNGKMRVHSAPGIGAELDEDYLKGHMAAGEVWWGSGGTQPFRSPGPARRTETRTRIERTRTKELRHNSLVTCI